MLCYLSYKNTGVFSDSWKWAWCVYAVDISHSHNLYCVTSMHLLFRSARSSFCLFPSSRRWRCLQGGRAVAAPGSRAGSRRWWWGAALGQAAAAQELMGASVWPTRISRLPPATSPGVSPSSHVGLNPPLPESKQWEMTTLPFRNIFLSILFP